MTVADPIARVAFIGLGHMGGHMCRNVITAGFAVTAYDLDPDALARAAADGARAADERRRLRARRRDPPHQPPGPAPGRRRALRHLGERVGDRGHGPRLDRGGHEHQLAGGGPQGPRRGRRRRGSPARRARRRPDDRRRGRDAGHLRRRRTRGVRAGAAGAGGDGRPAADLPARPRRLRLRGQAPAQPHVVHPGRGHRRGAHHRRQGRRGPLHLHTALVASPANSVFLERDVLPLLERGDYDEGFAMKLVTKDLGLAIDLARDVGVPVELSSLVEQIHRRARAVYGDEAGEMSAVRLYEDLAGVELRWHT